MMPLNYNRMFAFVATFMLYSIADLDAFQPATIPTSQQARVLSSSALFAATQPSSSSSKKGYVPKWKKKATMAEQGGGVKDLGFDNVGIKGTIEVVFKQGNETKLFMASPGQPIRDVASQAGQFIKYGCGKGECGTCECLSDGKYIRPCQAVVPPLPSGEKYVIQVPDVKNKSTSSGTFFSVKSFFKGFWNNLLGMVGFVKYRRAARKNWEERQEYENLIAQKTLEKKLARQQRELEEQNNKKL